MGLFKTLNFSIFTFINASNLKFCTWRSEVALSQKTWVFYAENIFDTQFADKSAFPICSWVGFEAEIAYAPILTQQNKTVIVQNLVRAELYVSAIHSQARAEDNSYCYYVTANQVHVTQRRL